MSSTPTENPKNTSRKLAKYEERIEEASRAFLVAAYALRAIHDEGLYPDPTFEAYVRRRWGFTSRRAYQLIQWAKLHEEMGARGHERLPLTEAEARPLTALSAPAARDAVWSNVTGRRQGDPDRPVTRTEVQSEVEAYRTAKSNIEAEDGVDESVPEGALPSIVIHGESPLVDAYGRVAGDPSPAVKGQGEKSEGLLVNVPGTLFEQPSRPLHLVDAGRLPFEFERDSIQAMAAEARRMGLKSEFNVTNQNVDWARFTWNPITGCVHDCVFCYARDLALRYYEQGFTPTFYPNRLAAPALTKVPDGAEAGSWERRVFTGSMGDLFARVFPDPVVQAVIDAMAAAPQWTFLLLTKLPARLPDFEFPPNVWVGTTVVDQASAKRAEKAMARVRASVRWVSLEPLLGPVRFEDPGIFDWFVIGAQTRTWQVPDKQPDPGWVYDLLLQAAGHGVEPFMKDNLEFAIRRSPTPTSTPATA